MILSISRILQCGEERCFKIQVRRRHVGEYLRFCELHCIQLQSLSDVADRGRIFIQCRGITQNISKYSLSNATYYVF